jgi:REP-associated tyrosine transposase
MTRPLRIPLAGGAYHVFARGNAKQAIFLDDRDHRVFLDLFVDALSRFSWHCLAYCLMPNHYHLVVRTREPDLSRGMRHVNGVYAQRFNRRHDRVGHVFQGRFGSTLIQADEHLLAAIRYVVRNPVRAGLVSRVVDWPWSSQRELLRLAPRKALSAPEVLELFGSSPESAMKRYVEFIEADDPETQVESPPILGDRDFKAKYLPEPSAFPEISREAWKEQRPALRDLLGSDNTDRAIDNAYRVHGYTMREIAEELSCHYATVSRRLRRFSSQERL